MKKLLLALVVLVGLGSTAMAQTKIGHVDMQMLWDTIPSSAVAAQKYQAFEEQLYKELQEMQASYQKAVVDYQNAMRSAEPPSEMRRSIMEQEIGKKERDLQERQQTAQLEMQIRQSELEQPIQDRIIKSIKIVAEREKLSYVLDKSTTYYNAGGIDVTSAVLVELMKLEKEAAEAAAKTTTPAPNGGQQ